MNTSNIKKITSFVRREGRFTVAQEKALKEFWPIYGVEYSEGFIQPENLFKQQAPVIIEIGFGMGMSFLNTIQHQPQYNFIGIEVHRPGVGAFLHQAYAKQLTNVRVFCHDAVEVLKACIPNASIDKICIFFPDPWPKKRHHKRRLIQPDFVALLTEKLKDRGILHCATDWENYAQHMLSVLTASSCLRNTSATDDFVPRPISRYTTKYEHRGQRLGHTVRDIIFEKMDCSNK